MSRFRRFAIVENSPSYVLKETSFVASPKPFLLTPFFPSFPVVEEDLDFVDLSEFLHPPPLLLDEFDTITDVIQIQEAPFRATTRRVTRRVGLGELYLEKLCDRVSDLELGFERLVNEEKARRKKIGERKYTWTAEIETPEKARKFKWTAEIKDGKDEEETGLKKSYKWTAQIQGKKNKDYLPFDQTYKLIVSSGDSSSSESEEETDKKKKNKKNKKDGKAKKDKSNGSAPRVVEIEDSSDHGAIVLKQVFKKRMEKRKGKRKELSAQDAAAMIQLTFRAYMIRRSQALRALRELAVAKSKLKEIRALFNNFSYRRRLSRDAEERQRFSEKIIVLLLTVDAVEGADLMVRAAKKAMEDELEAMLDVVDPQPAGKSWSVKRRTFDMPDGVMNEELAAGVAQVVRMLDQEASGSETFEACL